MNKKGFRLSSTKIDLLKKSMNSIKNDAVKDVAKQVVDNHTGGDGGGDTTWGKIIVGHLKHVTKPHFD